MKRGLLIILSTLYVINNGALSQKSLVFEKNDTRFETYRVGETISFEIKDNNQKVTQEIRGFTDSLIIFPTWHLAVQDISALYVDEKTKRWYPLRYKYDKIFTIAGAGYLLADLVSTGKFRGNTLLVSGLLLGAGAAARVLIGQKIKIKGKRKLMIAGKEGGIVGSYK